MSRLRSGGGPALVPPGGCPRCARCCRPCPRHPSWERRGGRAAVPGSGVRLRPPAERPGPGPEERNERSWRCPLRAGARGGGAALPGRGAGLRAERPGGQRFLPAPQPGGIPASAVVPGRVPTGARRAPLGFTALTAFPEAVVSFESAFGLSLGSVGSVVLRERWRWVI